MKTFLVSVGAACVLAFPGAALAQDTLPSPKTTASAECKKERAQMGKTAFNALYGYKANSNGIGKCVSKRTKTEETNQSNAAKDCKAERAADPVAFANKYGTNKNKKNAYGKCVSGKAKAAATATTKSKVNAAKQCKADRKADPAAFATKWGTKKNAFGKCVSATAKAKPYSPPQS